MTGEICIIGNKDMVAPPAHKEIGDDERSEANRIANRQTIGMILFTAVGLLASARNGFLGNLPHPYLLGVFFSMLIGAVAGILMFSHYKIVALTCCPLAAVCGYAALNLYLSGRDSVNTVELVLVQSVASLPAIIIGNMIRIFVYSSKTNQDEHRESGG